MTRLFHSLHLLVELSYSVVGIARRDAVDENETLAISDPLISQGSVFFLTSGIQDFQHARLGIYYDLFPVRVFDGGIVCFHKVIEA